MQALDRIRLLVAAVPWRATAYVAPHEYVMADWTRETEELVRLVMQEVRGQDGYSRMFRGAPFPTWHLDDHYYWMMPWGRATSAVLVCAEACSARRDACVP